MNCCQCQGIEEVFSHKYVSKELKHYHLKGPAKTTLLLVEDLKRAGLDGSSLLDIGGGIGAIQHELLSAGIPKATHVDASSAYLTAAKSEARQRLLDDRINFLYGNFVELARNIPPADIVTLDRVICCYDDMEKLVKLSAERALKLYGVVYPRSTWWIRFVLALGNVFLRIKGSPYRAYTNKTEDVEALITQSGLKRRSYHQTLIWQVVVFSR